MLLLLLSAHSFNISAQYSDVWKKNFGGSGEDYFHSVTAVSDGIIAVGFSWENSFDNGDWEGVSEKGIIDAIIVKYNHDGTVAWKKNFGGSRWDRFNSVTAVSDGIIAVGNSSADSFGNGDWEGVTGKGDGDFDAIIVKYNHDGSVAWKKNFGGSDLDVYYSVTSVSDGIIAVGHSYPNSFGNGDWEGVTGKGHNDAIIVKYNLDGTVAWKKNFGGSRFDCFNAVAVSDGIIAVGHSDNGSFGNGDWEGVTGKGFEDAIIVKYNHDGSVVWKKNFGGSYDDYYNSVTAVSDGIIAVGGSSADSFGTGDWAGVTGKGYYDAIIVKYYHDGSVAWKKNFGGEDGDQYISVTAVSDGIIAVGFSGGNNFGTGDWEGVTGKGWEDAIIVKYNHDGTVVWKKNFGGSNVDHYHSVTAVSDGIIAVGYSYEDSFGNGDWENIVGKGSSDAIIVKYIYDDSGVKQLRVENGELRVYPNPTTGELIMENGEFLSETSGKAERTMENIEIFDMFGHSISPAGGSRGWKSLNTLEIKLDISHFPAGVYFLRVDGQTVKIIKN